MTLTLEKDLLISYACYIDSYKDLALIEYSLLIISKKCKIIGITYSTSNFIDEKIVKDKFSSLEKYIVNLKVFGNIENIGTDFRKHEYTIKKFQEEELDEEYILLMNDSVIPIAISFNKAMFKLSSLMNEGYEFIGFLASNEIMRHYQSWFWCCDKNTINWIVTNIVNISPSCSSKQDFIIKIEIALSNTLIKNKKSKALYDFNINNNLFYHVPHIYIKALENEFPFLKKNYFSTKFRTDNILEFKEEILNYVPKNILEKIFR